MDWNEYTRMFVGLIAIVSPISVVPLYLSFTENIKHRRQAVARTTAFSVACIFIVAMLLGQSILAFFSISIDAFRVAGGILLMSIAFSMLQVKINRTGHTPEEDREAVESPSVAVVPLAMPLPVSYTHLDVYKRQGYALPGTVLAIGVYVPLVWLDGQLSELALHWFQLETGQLIQGTLAIMLIAYLIRFMAVSHYPIDSAMQRVTHSIDEAAMSLGVHGWAMIRTVHIPILKPGIFTAATLVFVDVMKEMPITLMTRPFGWDTLAVRIYEMTSEGQWEQAALPAVTLILAGLIPIYLFMRQTEI